MKLVTTLARSYDISGGSTTFTESSPVSNTIYKIEIIATNLTYSSDSDHATIKLEEADDGHSWSQVGCHTVELTEGWNTFHNVGFSKSQYRLNLTQGTTTGGVLSIQSTVTKADNEERYTEAQRDTLTDIAIGQKVYNSTQGYYEFWNGTEWKSMSSGEITSAIYFSSPITPTTLTTASEDDYNPTGLTNTNMIRLSSSRPAGTDVTGLVAPDPVKNQVIFLTNIGVKTITLKNNDSGSIAVNRFNIKNNQDLGDSDSALIVYDGNELRWRIVSAYL